MDSIYCYIIACTGTMFFIKIFDSPAKRLGLIDIPSGRKNHNGEIPLTGGLAMFMAICLTVLWHKTLGGVYIAIFPAILVLVIIGIYDDRFDLSASSRFIAQAIAALLMIYMGNGVITDLGNLFGGGPVRLGALQVPFTVFCVIGVINAINMLDGIDGLAGGMVLVTLILLGCMALLNGNSNQATLLFLLASTVVGFIVFNMRSPWRSSAAVFMGDSGSMMLGFAVAWFAVDLTQQANKAFAPITAVWILAIPILDTVSLMLRRALKGRSPFSPDHDHLHHTFLRLGFSVQQTVALIVSLSLALGLIGIGAGRCGVPEYMMFYGFVFLFVVYFFSMLHSQRVLRLLKKIHSARLEPET